MVVRVTGLQHILKTIFKGLLKFLKDL